MVRLEISQPDLTRSAVNVAAHGNSPGGDPIVYDYAFHSFFELPRPLRPPYWRSPRCDSGIACATHDASSRRVCARLALGNGRRRWQRRCHSRGAGAGGIRFCHVEWEEPADFRRGILLCPHGQRRPSGPTLWSIFQQIMKEEWLFPSSIEGRRLKALSRNGMAARIEPWLRCRLPDEYGAMRWMRTSFELEPAIRFDYQAPVRNECLTSVYDGGRVISNRATPLEETRTCYPWFVLDEGLDDVRRPAVGLASC